MPTLAEQLQQHSATKTQTLADQLKGHSAGANTQPPTAPAPSHLDGDGSGVGPHPNFQRNVQIGTQGVGRGLADLVGLPVDISQLLSNALMATADKGVQLATGGEHSIPYRFRDSFGSSDQIAGATSDLVEQIPGVDLIEQADMTPSERTRYAINRFGTEAATAGGLISKFRHLLPAWLSAPYEAPGSEARVLLGDTAAGAGTGATLSAYNEYLPDDVKRALGPLGELITALVGGVGGNTLVNAGESATQLARAPAARMSVPEDVLPRDPETMVPYRRKDLENASSLYQRQATDPDSALAEIRAYLNSMEGAAPHPTSALIADDPGLLSAERRARAGEASGDFIAADRAVLDSASDAVHSVRPETGNPDAARSSAASSLEEMLAAARAPVTVAQDAVIDQDTLMAQLGEVLRSGRGKDQASRDLDRVLVDETYIPERSRKNMLYDEAAGDPDVVVRTDAARRNAQDQLDSIDRSNPVLRDSESRKIAEAFTHPKGDAPTGTTAPSVDVDPDAPVVRSLADVLQDRMALSNVESSARAQGEFARADTARSVKSGINEDIRNAAESGVPGTEKLAVADQNYREQFAPFFREGTVAPDFFKKVDSDPKRGSTPPEATANKFLIAGPNSRAAAEDVATILRIAPDPEAGQAAVREYVMADAAGKGVIRDGKVNETALAKFISAREGMFSQFPELRAEFDELLGNVRAGNAQSNELAANLKEAVESAQLTERDINAGALRLIADSDPAKAVGSILGGKDPVAAMREAVANFASDPDAAEGWKAAVADYLVNQVTTASKAAVSNGSDTVSLPALSRLFAKNEKALAEVFTPAEMSNLRQVQKRLEVMSNRGAQASTGSATAENLTGMRGLIHAIAGPAGAVTLLTRGALMAGSVERRVKMVADQFPDADAAARKIIALAHFDPKVAEHLLAFPTAEAQVYTWTKRLNQLIGLQASVNTDAEESP